MASILATSAFTFSISLSETTVTLRFPTSWPFGVDVWSASVFKELFVVDAGARGEDFAGAFRDPAEAFNSPLRILDDGFAALMDDVWRGVGLEGSGASPDSILEKDIGSARLSVRSDSR